MYQEGSRGHQTQKERHTDLFVSRFLHIFRIDSVTVLEQSAVSDVVQIDALVVSAAKRAECRTSLWLKLNNRQMSLKIRFHWLYNQQTLWFVVWSHSHSWLESKDSCSLVLPTRNEHYRNEDIPYDWTRQDPLHKLPILRLHRLHQCIYLKRIRRERNKIPLIK